MQNFAIFYLTRISHFTNFDVRVEFLCYYRIGKRIIEVTGDKKAKSYLFQRIGIAVQRGNAASIMGTVPPGQKLYELYYL